jgi:hypothetical protein
MNRWLGHDRCRRYQPTQLPHPLGDPDVLRETLSMRYIHPAAAWIDSMPLGKLDTRTEEDTMRPSPSKIAFAFIVRIL